MYVIKEVTRKVIDGNTLLHLVNTLYALNVRPNVVHRHTGNA